MSEGSGISITLNPFSWFSPAKVEQKAEEKKEEKKEETLVYKNEFSELYHEFSRDLGVFRDKYPLTTIITIVAFAVLGFSMFFSFSFTGWVSSALYFTTSYCLAKSVGNKGMAFWTNIKNSLFEIFQASRRIPPEVPEEKS